MDNIRYRHRRRGGVGSGCRSLRGASVGTLQYRDYRSDARVTLPTTLVVTPSATGFELAYTCDDGPGKMVRSIQAQRAVMQG